jgi:hypothetical protein
VSKNGKAAEKPDMVEALSLNEHLAISIAHGAAGSTFELTRVREGNAQLVNGRCWYAGGKSFDNSTVIGHVHRWVEFIGTDATIPPDALWGYVRAELALGPGKWAQQPLSTRLAFAVFVSTLVPLLKEARAEAKRLAAEVAAKTPQPAPADKGVWARSLNQRAGRMGERVVLSAPRDKLEAAE